MDYLAASAVIDGDYRYRLIREWSVPGTVGRSDPCVFIMLNPSTADGRQDDPTIRKCVGFAGRWGFTRLIVVNLFAYRATNPKDLRRAADPIGPRNAEHVKSVCAEIDYAICAWGTNGSYLAQDAAMLRLLHQIGVIPMGIGTKSSHPLYLPYDSPVVELR